MLVFLSSAKPRLGFCVVSVFYWVGLEIERNKLRIRTQLSEVGSVDCGFFCAVFNTVSLLTACCSPITCDSCLHQFYDEYDHTSPLQMNKFTWILLYLVSPHGHQMVFECNVMQVIQYDFKNLEKVNST